MCAIKSSRERTHTILDEHTHIIHSIKTMNNQKQINSIGFTIKYQTPYTQEWRTQSFTTIEEAERMIAFYRSCGSPAELIK
jgi:hypothetical protein